MYKMIVPLVRFIGGIVLVEGVIELTVVTDRAPSEVTVNLEFLMVHTPSAYNVTLRRRRLNVL